MIAAGDDHEAQHQGERTVRQVLTAGTERLRDAGVDSPAADAATLLAWVLGLPRSALSPPLGIDAGQAAAFTAALARRAAREPLQHITGTAAFRHLDLSVGPGVFTPRPETEVMTGVAIDELRRLRAERPERALHAVDLCSGSGAVALSMATEVPGTAVTAVEISASAVAYLIRNSDALSAGIDIRHADIGEGIPVLSGVVDVVTANPPYIPTTEFEGVALEARVHDPPEALWSGEDGLDAIREVARVAGDLLRPGGLVVCEHADRQGLAAVEVFAQEGRFVDVRDHQDLTGRPRFVSARRAG